jgi:hypothetical protein
MDTTRLVEIAAGIFAPVDGLLASVVPPLVRLALWGVVAGLVSMLLYRLLSPQRRIALGKTELTQTRQALDACDGDLKDAWPLMRRMLRVALAQVWRTAGPVLLASVPLLWLLAWLDSAYDGTRGWELSFFISLLTASTALKLLLRIE